MPKRSLDIVGRSWPLRFSSGTPKNYEGKDLPRREGGGARENALRVKGTKRRMRRKVEAPEETDNYNPPITNLSPGRDLPRETESKGMRDRDGVRGR